MPLVAVADLVNSGAVAVGADAVGGELSVAADAPHVLKAVAAIAGLSLPLAPESLGRPVGVRGASIGVGSNAGAVTIAGLSLPLAETLRRPISIGGASVGVGSNGRTTIAITGLSLPLAKAAKAGLIDVSTTITIGADSVGGELGISTIDAGHSLVAATITIAGLSLPLAETLRRPISIGRATIGVGSNASAVSVVGWVGEGASREGEDQDLKHSTDTNSFFLSQPMHNTYNLGRHDLAY